MRTLVRFGILLLAFLALGASATEPSYAQLEREVLASKFRPDRPITAIRNSAIISCDADLQEKVIELGRRSLEIPMTGTTSRWMLRAAELLTSHTCDYVGSVYFDPEEYELAYKLYSRAGARTKAREVAIEAADADLSSFLIGEWWWEGHPDDVPYGDGQFRPELYASAVEWLRRAGFTSPQIATRIRADAQTTLDDMLEYADSPRADQRAAVRRLVQWVKNGCRPPA